MAAVKPIDRQINLYLAHLSVAQKEVVLSVVKNFVGKEEIWWDDKKYVAEMDRRFAELETGKIQGLTLEEMEAGARQAYKKSKRKK